jgi:hypothetical protein
VKPEAALRTPFSLFGVRVAPFLVAEDDDQAEGFDAADLCPMPMVAFGTGSQRFLYVGTPPMRQHGQTYPTRLHPLDHYPYPVMILT